MMQHVMAIYENGIFRPLSPLDLAEHSLVQLNVSQRTEDSVLASPAVGEISPEDFDRNLDELSSGNSIVVGTHPRSEIYIDHD